jgi:nitrate/TMAO reductase-like tetraheme cytochrome c subunit
MERKLPPYFYNPISLIGISISLLSLGLIFFLIVLDLFNPDEKPYMGIITFIILPSFLISGLIISIYGIIRERNREKRGFTREKKFPVIDLNDTRKRNAFLYISSGLILFLILSAFGSYRAYEYTETDAFCGLVCHKVMEPEYVAYLDSPHSRVGCVQCHIGSGTSWYVKSKLSGAYQVYSTLFNKYSRPIPTPVKELRPAEGTCEQCHSPSHFFSEKKVEYTYYLSDENNTKSKLTMLVKIGGGNNIHSSGSGIHWHMNVKNKVYYIHTDERRLEIPWVKVVDENGNETIYKSKNFDIQKANLPPENFRLMDCIDCHNRPSHIFHQPDKMTNLYLQNKRIDESLPYIKSLVVEALEKNYSDKKVGLDSIRYSIENFYRINYPEIYRSKNSEINSAIISAQQIYDRNYFTYMQANWKKFPDNIAHTYTPGCFRCHDGKHFSDDGKVISKDCNSCHIIISQELPNGKKETSLEGLNFVHPVDFGESINEHLCTDCHFKLE